MVDGFVPPDKTIHIRGLFYTRADFVNNFDCYEFLKNAAEPARWLGYVPFEPMFGAGQYAPDTRTGKRMLAHGSQRGRARGSVYFRA
jgi:hypothetical protein